MADWLLVDDNHEEAAAFAAGLTQEGTITVRSATVTEAEEALADRTLNPAGLLLDVDLSNEVGLKTSGPGLAQDIRVAQQVEALNGFPIVRFSYRANVAANIGQDPTSDNLFDLKVEKDGLSDEAARIRVRKELLGIREVYDALRKGNQDLKAILGVNETEWADWGNSSLGSAFAQGDRVHSRAAPIVRLLKHPGLLIDEQLLTFRLGIDTKKSADYAAVLEQLQAIKYKGVASEVLPRWWARGIEQWWRRELGASTPLAGCSISQRVELLAGRFGDLTELSMPDGSIGDRPWRYCLISLEQHNELIPIDPAKSVRMNSRQPMPSWIDPLYASLGNAAMNREDPRLDPKDLERLKPFLKG